MSTNKLSQQEARRLTGGQMLLDGYDVVEVAQAINNEKTLIPPFFKHVGITP